MTRTAQLAKLTPPVISDVYPRARLFRRLDESLASPLVWISAPAGSGKTTLVASYLQERGRGVLWYQIDEGDSDPASLFYYLGLAAAKYETEAAEPMPLLTTEYVAGLNAFSRNFFRKLFERLPDGAVLVFDNYHDAHGRSGLHEALQQGVAEIPSGMNVIVVSRTDPPVPYARLRACGALTVLDWSDLSLTAEECRSIASMRFGAQAVFQDQLQQLHEHSRGWMAGLVLMVEQARHQGTPQLVKGGSRDVIFDYFAGEIFQQADEEVQLFLLQTALLPKISIPAAETLTGIENAERILTDLTRRNYFTFRHAFAAVTYEYHPLFREFLLNRAREHFSADELRQLRIGAARVLQAEGDFAEAVALLQEAGDWPSVTALILGQAADLIGQGRGMTLAQWIDALPSAVLADSPWLLYWLGVSHLPFDPPRARRHLTSASDLFKASGEVAGLLSAWCGIVDSIVFEGAAFSPLGSLIDEMEAYLRDGGDIPGAELDAQVACGMFLALMWNQPHHPQMPK